MLAMHYPLGSAKMLVICSGAALLMLVPLLGVDGPTESPDAAEAGPTDLSGGIPTVESAAGEAIVGYLDLEPDVINLKSNGKYVTGYLELPSGYSLNDVFVPSIKLNDCVYVETCFKAHIDDGYGDSNGANKLMMKFQKDRFLETLVPGDEVTVHIDGVLRDGTHFVAFDVISVFN
jgi:hypothetical protein